MKYLILFTVVVVLLAAAFICLAQPANPNVAAPPGAGANPMPGMTSPMNQMQMGQMQMGAGCMCPMCGMQMGGMTPDRMLAEGIQGLGLTDDQMTRLRDICMDFRKTQIRLTGDIEIAQIDLQRMLVQDVVDAQKAERQVGEINKLQGDLQITMVRSLLAARNVLTPEQRRAIISKMMRTGPMQQPASGGRGPMPMGPGASPPSGGPPQPPPPPAP